MTIKKIEFNWAFSEAMQNEFGYSYTVGELYEPYNGCPGGVVSEINERIKGGKLYYEVVFTDKDIVVGRIKIFNPNKVLLFV